MEDDQLLRDALVAIFEMRGFLVTAVETVPEALAIISNRPFDILLSDLNIGEPGDGFTVVSAMRRVQPEAATFILTGYPDFDTAIQGIRSQVDDYFAKPVDIEALIQTMAGGQRRPDRTRSLPPRKVSALLRESKQLILERWLAAAESEPELAEIPLTKQERTDHVPLMLEALIQRLESSAHGLLQRDEYAREHGHTRRSQGYTTLQVVLEARILHQVLTSLIESNLLGINFSTLVRDILTVGEFLNGALETSLRAFQSQLPLSLQSSISSLYGSPYLGLLIVGEERVIDANDAFLRMVRRTRDHLISGEIDWPSLTPSMYFQADERAVEELREFGTCAPYEKEFIRPNGSRVLVLIGAVRLQVEPLRWAAYALDLTEQRRAIAAEQKAQALEAKYELINRLAHELNNPLAAMTFALHLLHTDADLSNSAQGLVRDATEMLGRMSASVSQMLLENRTLAVSTSEG